MMNPQVASNLPTGPDIMYRQSNTNSFMSNSMPLTNSSPSIMQTPPQQNPNFFFAQAPPDLNQQFVSNLQGQMYANQAISTGFSNPLIYDNAQPNFMSPPETYMVDNSFPYGNINSIQPPSTANSPNNHGSMETFSSPALPQQSPNQQVPQQHQSQPSSFQPMSSNVFPNNPNLFSSVKTMTTPPSHTNTGILQQQFIPPSIYSNYHSQSTPNLNTFHTKLPNSQHGSHNNTQAQPNTNITVNKLNSNTIINKSTSASNLLHGNSVILSPGSFPSTAQTPPSPISSPSPHCSSSTTTPIILPAASITSSTPPIKEEEAPSDEGVTLKEKEDVARTAYKTWFVVKPGNKEVKDRWWALYYNKILPKYHLRDNHLGRKINQWIEEDMRELEKQGVIVPPKVVTLEENGENTTDTKKRKPNSTKEGSFPAYINVLLINPPEEKNSLSVYCVGNSLKWTETELESLVGLFKDNRQKIMDNINSKKKSLNSPSSPVTPSFTNAPMPKKAPQHKDKKPKAKTNETPQTQTQTQVQTQPQQSPLIQSQNQHATQSQAGQVPMIKLDINCNWVFAEVYMLNDSYWIKADLPGMESKDFNIETDDISKFVISGERKTDIPLESTMLTGKRNFGSFMIEAILPHNADLKKTEHFFYNGVLSIRCPLRTTQNPQSANKQ